MFERLTERTRRIVTLAQQEAKRLDHNYVGTEHILLGLIREGDGVAVQVLVGLGADQDMRRQRVVLMLHGHPVEQSGPDTSDLDAREQQLLAEKGARQELWDVGHPGPPDLAEQCRQLTDEVERLRTLLRQHGIDPHDEPA